MVDFIASNPFYRNVWQEGVSRGMKPYQIAGLIGNFQGESGGNPAAIGDKGHAIGAAQWNDRAPMLKAFAANQGTDWRDPTTQAKFVFHELDTSEKTARDKLLAAKNVQEAVNAGIGYERPAGFNDPSSWAAHPTLGYNRRLQGAQQALGDVSPHAFAANSQLGVQPNGPQDQAQGQPTQDPSSFMAMANEEQAPSGWETAGNIGSGLQAAGAALMAIDNPAGASALMSGLRAQKKLQKQPWQMRLDEKTGQMVRFNPQTGEVSSSQVPGYKPPEPEKTTSQQDFAAWQAMPPGDAKNAFGKAKGYVDKEEDGPALNPEGLDAATQLYARSGGKLGMTGLSKKAKEEVTNNLGKWAKDHDTTVDEIYANGPKYAGYMAQERDMGTRYNRMSTAKTEMDATLTTLEKTTAKLPQDIVNGTVPWNAFMQGSATYWNSQKRPELAAYRETLQNAANAYATLLARGATNVPVAMQNRANELFNTYMDPETVKAVTGTMRDTSDRMMQGMKYSQDNLRDEIAGKTPRHANVEAEIEAYVEERHKARQPAPAATPGQTAAPQGKPAADTKALDELRRRGLIK
jgi:hypothetical protein